MDIDCFVFPGWRPRIRSAGVRRDWMDATPDSFAYRCLPLGIANSHGWEISNAVGFSALWTGGSETGAIKIRLDNDKVEKIDAPTSLFGQGTLTFHIAGLFRTPPGWNLWISGPPNAGKDGIAPLSGVIETDWSPYTFTMNWRFTRPNHWVRFEADEPICFFFPVERGGVERVTPRVRSIAEAPQLKQQFEDWSRSRDEFQTRMRLDPPARPADTWQKLYYRGFCPAGVGAADHQTKLRVSEFADLADASPSTAQSTQSPATRFGGVAHQTGRGDWLLGVQQSLRALSPQASSLPRFERIEPNYFLDQHYAANRPAILAGEMTGWRALGLWTADYLSTKLGDATVELQAVRTGGRVSEAGSTPERHIVSFRRFIDEFSQPDLGRRAYLSAADSHANSVAFAPLHAELGRIEKLLSHGPSCQEAQLWIGTAGASTLLTHNPVNHLVAQLVGDNRVILFPPSEGRRLIEYNEEVRGHADPLNLAASKSDTQSDDLQCFDVLLQPGETLFIPVGWWHQTRAPDFCVNSTYANFRWRNTWPDPA